MADEIILTKISSLPNKSEADLQGSALVPIEQNGVTYNAKMDTVLNREQSFDKLSDTPASKSGNAGKPATVAANETDIEYADVQEFELVTGSTPADQDKLVTKDYVDQALGSTDKVIISIQNLTGSTIYAGQVVYPDGATGVGLANAHDKDKSQILAVVENDILDGDTGNVVKFGRVSDFDTSAIAIGGIAYLSDSVDGGLMPDKPNDGSFCTIMGIVEVSDATSGVLFVDITTSQLTVEVNDTNGFPPDQRENTELLINETTRTFTIQPKAPATQFHYYHLGSKDESTGDSIIWDDVEGKHWFYYDVNGLQVESNPTIAKRKSIILNDAFVASIYWNATDDKVEIDIMDERHGIGLSPTTHLQQHLSQGAFWVAGFQLGNITLGNGNANVDAQFSVSSGSYYDEDIEHIFSGYNVGFDGIVVYSEGISGDLRTGTQTGFSVLNAPSGRLYYNQWTGTQWQLTEVSNSDFVLYHDFGFNGQTENFITVMGQNEYVNAGAARAGAAIEISNIISQLPFSEMIPIATRIYQTRDTYTNDVKARIVVDDDGNPYVNWTESELVSGSAPSSHLNLTDVQLAGTGVTQGHIDDQAQSIYGEKTIYSDNINIRALLSGNDAVPLFKLYHNDGTLMGYIGSPTTSNNKMYLYGPDGLVLSGTLELDTTPIAGASTDNILVITSGGEVRSLPSKAYQSLTSGTAISMNTDSGQNAKVTLGHNATLTISNLEDGDEGNIIVTQDATGSRTLAISPTPKVINGGSGALTLSSGAGDIDILSYTYDGTNLFITYGKNYS